MIVGDEIHSKDERGFNNSSKRKRVTPALVQRDCQRRRFLRSFDVMAMPLSS